VGEQQLSELNVSGELKDNILASQLAVDGREGVELVLQRGGILGIQETVYILMRLNTKLNIVNPFSSRMTYGTYTLMVLEPSTLTRVLLPTISVG
jgi:hypothetical protein